MTSRRRDGSLVGWSRRRTIPHPVYSVSPDGKSAVTTDFRRIASVRPGYGYAAHFIWRDPGHILAQSRHWLGEGRQGVSNRRSGRSCFPRL